MTRMMTTCLLYTSRCVYETGIDVFLNEDKTVVFRDNGVGLKEEEVYRFLTVIGESSKR